MTNENEKKINHPPHYTRDGAMETIDEMLLIFGVEDTLAFCKLNAWKYRARALMKNGLEDLQKSDWYLNKYKEIADTNILEPESLSTNDYLKSQLLSAPSGFEIK